MKVVICGSMHCAGKMMEVAEQLRKKVDVILPTTLAKYGKTARELTSSYEQLLKLKAELARDHFEKIKDSDAILVVNEEKNGINGYIGGATFSEIAYAFYLRKRIFLTKPIPENLPYTDELRSFKPEILKEIEEINHLMHDHYTPL